MKDNKALDQTLLIKKLYDLKKIINTKGSQCIRALRKEIENSIIFLRGRFISSLEITNQQYWANRLIAAKIDDAISMTGKSLNECTPKQQEGINNAVRILQGLDFGQPTIIEILNEQPESRKSAMLLYDKIKTKGLELEATIDQMEKTIKQLNLAIQEGYYNFKITQYRIQHLLTATLQARDLMQARFIQLSAFCIPHWDASVQFSKKFFQL